MRMGFFRLGILAVRDERKEAGLRVKMKKTRELIGTSSLERSENYLCVYLMTLVIFTVATK